MATVTIEPSTLKFYFIESKLNELVLDIKDNYHYPNGSIVMYKRKYFQLDEADNQLWYFVEAGNGQYTIQSKRNSLALTFKTTDCDSPLITARNDGTNAQLWSLQFDGTEAIITSDSGFVMEANSESGGEVRANRKKDPVTENQQWRMLPQEVGRR